MLTFNIDGTQIELDYKGLKVIQSNNPLSLVAHLEQSLKNKKTVDTEMHHYREMLVITPRTTIDQLINLKSSNGFYKWIQKDNNLENLIDENQKNYIIQKINNYFDLEIVDENLDIQKLLNALFFLNDSFSVNWKIIKKFLEVNRTGTKQLIVLCELENINLEELQEELNFYDFILLYSDIKNVVKNVNYLEICAFSSDNRNFFEILDTKVLCEYLEKKCNEPILLSTLENWLKNEEISLLNCKISMNLTKIC